MFLPLCHQLEWTKRKEQLAYGGASSDCKFPCFLYPQRGLAKKGFIRKLLEYSRENQNPSVFSSGWSAFLGTHPQSLFPQKSKPQNKKNTGLSPALFPTQSPLVFLSFFLFLEPSEKHQETEASTLSYDKSLVL